MDLWTVILMNEKNSKDYTRLGGWLLFFLISLILNALLLSLSILSTLGDFLSGSATSDTDLLSLIISITLMAVPTIYMVVLICMLITANKRFRKLFIYGTLLNLILTVLLVAVVSAHVQDTAPLAENIASVVLSSVIWVTYFYRSERVRVYFGYPAKTEPHTEPPVPGIIPDQISAHSDQIAPTTQQPISPSSGETTLKISRSAKYWIAGLITLCLLGLAGTGIHAAISDAYDSGFNDGFNTALPIGYDQGYNAGEDSGYTTGYTQGKNTGYLNGYRSGEMTGYLNGFDDAVANYGQYTITYIEYVLSKSK